MIKEEVYDVVDKSGNVIGRATWSEVHSKGLLHQNVHGILFKNQSKKQTLIKKRSKIMPQEAGVYEIAVAGHMLSGKTPDQSIIKEIEEELLGGGKIPKKLKINRLTRFFNNDLPNNHELVYLYEIIYPGPFIIDEESEEEPMWIFLDDLVRQIGVTSKKFAKFSINAIEEYIRYTKKFSH